jgi:hypothetical protein
MKSISRPRRARVTLVMTMCTFLAGTILVQFTPAPRPIKGDRLAALKVGQEQIQVQWNNGKCCTHGEFVSCKLRTEFNCLLGQLQCLPNQTYLAACNPANCNMQFPGAQCAISAQQFPSDRCITDGLTTSDDCPIGFPQPERCNYEYKDRNQAGAPLIPATRCHTGSVLCGFFQPQNPCN